MRLLSLAILVVACASCSESECFTDPMDYAVDPKTAACIIVSNDDGCAFCFDHCVVGDVKTLDYGACHDTCSSASESACLMLSGCRAAYAGAGASFTACLPTAPSGALHDGACRGLDADACSRHDNCSALYIKLSDGSMAFERCVDEALTTTG